ncbi:MAG TPA: SufS family cysteine desulfurase [Microthrixaceae bacterium]|nr:SufS family cysteine desulfurase [Microthrixaceae bacterium]
MTDTTHTHTLDTTRVKADFPLLASRGDLTYLDSAASAQKPRVVIDTMSEFYETTYANVARGVYGIAEEATNRVEAARAKVARFIGAPSADEIVFTKNATEGLNLVAQSWGRANLRPGDAVLLTEMEHHANIVPWQILAGQLGLEIRWIPVGDDGLLRLDDLDRLLDGVRVLGVSAMSNVLGTLNPVTDLAAAAHAAGAIVSVDACQFVPHNQTDVVAMGADFISFSGHKMLGPTGVGVLWGRAELLEAMPPFLGGGGMIEHVTVEGFSSAPSPHKFEAGTPPIVEIVGLGAAIDYLEDLGMDRVREHEVTLTAYALRTLGSRFGDSLRIHGPSEPAQRGGVFSLALDDLHPHDVSQVLDTRGVCVRAGHHCAKPLMKVLGVGATARASVYVYNDESDIDALADALAEAQRFFAL